MKVIHASVIVLGMLASACGGAQSTSSAQPAGDDSVCTEIGHACHDVDHGEGDAHMCHVSAHSSWTRAECAEHRDHCLSVCSGPSHDGAHSHTGESQH